MDSLTRDLFMVISFVPILGYGVIVATLKLSKSLTFNANLFTLVVAAVAQLGLSITAAVMGLGWLGIFQFVSLIIFFFLVIFFLGGKVGPETIFAFCALIGLPPLIQGWAIPGLIAGLTVFVTMIVIHMRLAGDSLTGALSTNVMNAIGDIHAMSITDVYGNVPDKKEMRQEASTRTFTMVPTVLAVGFVGIAWNLIF